nr:10497_t:CDS:2 [Entrophospora candida]
MAVVKNQVSQIRHDLYNLLTDNCRKFSIYRANFIFSTTLKNNRGFRDWTKLEIKQLESLVEKLGENWKLVSKYMFTKSPTECHKKYQSLLNLNLLPDHHKRTRKKKYEKESTAIWKDEEIKLLNDLFELYGRKRYKICKNFPNKSSHEIEYFVKKNPDKFPSLYKSIHSTSVKWSKDEMKVLNDLILKYRNNYDLFLKYASPRTPTPSSTMSSESTTPSSHLPWSRHEINKLNELVEKYGQNWNKISEHLPGRIAASCELKYDLSWNLLWNQTDDSKAASLVKHDWPKEVIDAVNLLVNKYGKWQLIPLLLPEFTPFFCNSRIPKTHKWKSIEKKSLKELIGKYGFDWDKLVCFFPHKGPSELRRHALKHITDYHPYYHVSREIKSKAQHVEFYKPNYRSLPKPVQDNSNCWTISRKFWTDTERNLLKDLLKQYGHNYEHLTSYFPGRTFKSIKNQVLIMWTPDEEIQLVKLVEVYHGKWKEISEIMKIRSPSACYRKYYSILNPESKRGQLKTH